MPSSQELLLGLGLFVGQVRAMKIWRLRKRCGVQFCLHFSVELKRVGMFRVASVVVVSSSRQLLFSMDFEIFFVCNKLGLILDRA